MSIYRCGWLLGNCNSCLHIDMLPITDVAGGYSAWTGSGFPTAKWMHWAYSLCKQPLPNCTTLEEDKRVQWHFLNQIGFSSNSIFKFQKICIGLGVRVLGCPSKWAFGNLLEHSETCNKWTIVEGKLSEPRNFYIRPLLKSENWFSYGDLRLWVLFRRALLQNLNIIVIIW